MKGLPKNIYSKAKIDADNALYEHISNSDEDVDIPVWSFVTLPDCKQIVLNGKNWSILFEDALVRPEETNLPGGKDTKTDWIIKLNTINNKLAKETYSVSGDEFTYVKSIYEWIAGILVL